MELKHLIDLAWKGLDGLHFAGVQYEFHAHPGDPTRRYRTDGQPPLPVGDDRTGNWYVDARPDGSPHALTALEHAFGRSSRECVMDGERCLHWELGDVQVVATRFYLQLTLRQPDINSEPDPKRMVN
jgi:hypothetical protein